MTNLNDMDTIELINMVAEFNDVHEFMHDEQVDRALELIVRVITKPDIPPHKAVALVAELQALSSKFAVLAAWYSTAAKGRAGSENHTKKNIYYSLRDATEKLSDSVKYSARAAVYA